jgi:hypothetical protein
LNFKGNSQNQQPTFAASLDMVECQAQDECQGPLKKRIGVVLSTRASFDGKTLSTANTEKHLSWFRTKDCFLLSKLLAIIPPENWGSPG